MRILSTEKCERRYGIRLSIVEMRKVFVNDNAKKLKNISCFLQPNFDTILIGRQMEQTCVPAERFDEQDCSSVQVFS